MSHLENEKINSLTLEISFFNQLSQKKSFLDFKLQYYTIDVSIYVS